MVDPALGEGKYKMSVVSYGARGVEGRGVQRTRELPDGAMNGQS